MIHLSKTFLQVIQSSSSASLKKSTFKKMVLDFVSTLKSTPARDANEKAEMLEKIDQKIREGEKFCKFHFGICFEFIMSDLHNPFISAPDLVQRPCASHDPVQSHSDF